MDTKALALIALLASLGVLLLASGFVLTGLACIGAAIVGLLVWLAAATLISLFRR